MLSQTKSTPYGLAIDGVTNAFTTIPFPTNAYGLALSSEGLDLDPVTNRIYVASAGIGNGPGGITVIDGNSDTVTNTLPTGNLPFAVAVNPITNMIYMTNEASNTVTVVDGATLSTTTIPVGSNPLFIAVNPVTNKIYVANEGSNNITVIDGSTNTTITLTDPTASAPWAVAVDALTNQIYVANNASATVTVIDGATNALTSVALPNASGTGPIALDPLTNTVYALNTASNNVNVIAGVAGTGAPDFAIGATSASLTLSAGGEATDTIIVGPPYGNTVDLSCTVSGPSPAPTCELSATSITPGPTYGTATLTITAPSAAAMQAPFKAGHLNRLAYVAWLPLAFGITLAGALKRRSDGLLLGGFVLLLALSLVACGGGSPSGGGNPGPTNYTVTVAGISSAIQHTTQVTVTVE
jgi:YVTN family beta-propeller protein